MKVCIVQLGRIGDLILLTPMINAIKEKFPDSQIDFLVGPSNYNVLKDNKHLNKIIVSKKDPISIIKTFSKILFRKYDFWIDPKDHFSNESKIFAKISRANHKIGFNLDEIVFDIGLPETDALIHHVLIGLSALKPLGIELNEKIPQPTLYLNSESEIYTNEFLSENNIDKFYLLNISASNDNKMLNYDVIDKFLENALTSRYKWVICSDPRDRQIAKSLCDKHNIPNFKSRSINDIFSICDKSSLVITPDTSIVHIAAAFNKPILAFYSGLDHFYQKFYPLSEVFEVVRAKNGDSGIKSINFEDILISFHKIIDRLNHLN